MASCDPGPSTSRIYGSPVGGAVRRPVLHEPPPRPPEPLLTFEDIIKCKGCEQGNQIFGTCLMCNEYLCDACICAHKRVNLTKDHPIKIWQSASPSSTCLSDSAVGSMESVTSFLQFCDIHRNVLTHVCRNCSVALCSSCSRLVHKDHQIVEIQDVVEKAKREAFELLGQANVAARVASDALCRIEAAIEGIKNKVPETRLEIDDAFNGYVLALRMRQERLRFGYNAMITYKLTRLTNQRSSLKAAITKVKQVSDFLEDSFMSCNPLDFLSVHEVATRELSSIKIPSSLRPCEENNLGFVGPDCGFEYGLLQLGVITPVQPAHPVNNFDVPLSNTLYHYALNDITTRLANQELPSNCRPVYGRVKQIRVRQHYDTATPKVFGREGSEDGELCRPWGVCCNSMGHIIVADRSNNRVQVFTPSGDFLYKFGSGPGSKPGEFDRPAGITVNYENEIVVADKDNHRLQVFSMDGTFRRAVGRKGHLDGEFNYPWDVACNQRCDIIVSDTRNHRLQLFDKFGRYLRKICMEHFSYKVLESPRGVCFDPNGNVLVTDFNNHWVVRFDKNDAHKYTVIGESSHSEKIFDRPQGIVCDDLGNMIIADSKNNKIKVFHSNGVFAYEFGEHGVDPGQFDRPTDVCLSPAGQLVVVDFANTRVQIF